MLFNSISFAIFFTIVLIVVFLLERKNTPKKIFLILASFFFYMFWKADYAWLLGGSILFNFTSAKLIAKIQNPGKRKLYITLAIAGNLLLLCIFKYADFIIININYLMSLFNLGPIKPLNIILPIGISFFTFQAMCYIIDVYKGKIKPASLVDTSLYISFFPHLIAGPIIKAVQIIPQFDVVKILRNENFVIGSHRIFWGLIKKMVIADNLAIFVNQVFGAHSQYNWLTQLIAVYAFAFQIYCDFSGYSDIAIGCFRIMGYEIAENFNLPYIATDFSDFWKRWHISLSTWLRDYLYIPLGGNRKGIRRTYINVMITMFLGGLWHGAKWTFVFWGILHGIYLMAQKFFEKKIVIPKNALTDFLKIFLTFQLVCLTWIFFRAENFHSACGMLFSIVTFKGGTLYLTGGVMVLLFVSFLLHILKGRFQMYNIFMSLPYQIRYAAYSIGIFLLFFNKASVSTQFIYFQF